MTHICVSKPTIIGSDNGLSPYRRQAIIWTNGGILLIGPLGTNFSEISIEIQTFSLKKIRLKMSSAKCCSFRLGLNVLKRIQSKGATEWEQRKLHRSWSVPIATTQSLIIFWFSNLQRGGKMNTHEIKSKIRLKMRWLSKLEINP